MKANPVWEHDKTCCKFLGTVLNAGDKLVDLYYCPTGGPTVIARYSNEPSDYTSGICFALEGRIQVLEVALLRAILAGYCDKDGKPLQIAK